MGAHWKLAQPGDPLLRLANPARNPEEQEQKMVIQWAQANAQRLPGLRYLFHIPNGSNKSKAQAGIFKALGLKRGVSDLFLPVPVVYEPYPDQPFGGRWAGLWIEMKAVAVRTNTDALPPRHEVKLGTVAPEQLDWLQAMIDQGYAASIAWDRSQAQLDLERYLTGRWRQEPLSHYLGGRIA